ncbi:MAG: outer membrane beta-barrel protein [Saprospiraceae bacterium]|nr:outer membrane beta-barrel protein [Saprospiraceae bacterium]
MKSLQKIIVLTLIGCLLSFNSFSQKGKAVKARENAEKARDNVTEAVEIITDIAADCPELTARQMKEIKKQMEKAKAELEKAKTEAKNATAAALASRARDKVESTAAATAAEAAVTAAEEALAEAVASVPGIRASNKIKEELDNLDVSDHSEKEKMKTALQDEAVKAGYENPCDSSLVRKAVELKLDSYKNKYNEQSNRALHEWLLEVEKKLKQLVLVSFESEGDLEYVAQGSFPHRFTVELFGGIIFTPNEGTVWPLSQQLGDLEKQIFTDPGTFEKLFESLGGEFFLGDFSEAPKPLNPQATTSWIWGFGSNYSITPNFSVAGSLHFAHHELHAVFPVTIFNSTNGEMQSTMGQLNARVATMRGRIGGQYTLGQGLVRPFAGVGIQYTRAAVQDVNALLSGVPFDSELEVLTKSLGAYGTAGIEVHPTKLISFRVSAFTGSEKMETGSKQLETVWAPGLSIGAGLKF